VAATEGRDPVGGESSSDGGLHLREPNLEWPYAKVKEEDSVGGESSSDGGESSSPFGGAATASPTVVEVSRHLFCSLHRMCGPPPPTGHDPFVSSTAIHLGELGAPARVELDLASLTCRLGMRSPSHARAVAVVEVLASQARAAAGLVLLDAEADLCKAHSWL
jgi:hypothetical protein